WCAFPAAERMDGRIPLTGPANDPWATATVAVQEERAVGEAGPGLTRRRFRYGQPISALILLNRPAALVAPGLAHATVEPLSDGRMLVRFDFRFGDSLARPGTVRLPPGASLVSARVDGREVANPVEDSDNGRQRVVLPWPADAGTVGELVYECPAPSWRFMTRAAVVAPEFPHSLAVRWSWRLPARPTPVAPPTRDHH